jgi:TRAP-type mannitol/chloroaromatic compound transport system permease small subunit
MLVAIAFLSLPVSHINGAFHRVEFVQARLSTRGKIISSIFFELVALFFCAIFVWQFIGLVRSSWRFGDHAPTFLETPLWIPRSLLVIGMAALCLSLVRSMAADIGRLRSLGNSDRARNGS